MEYQDYYATLGVPRTATQAEIKKAFRKLARKHHPDANKGDAGAEARFKEVNEANAVLADPEKRKLYDQLGSDWQAYSQGGRPAPGRGAGASGGNPFAGFRGTASSAGTGPGGIRYEFHGNPEDLEGFSDFFQTFFGGPAAGFNSPPTRGTGSRGASARRTARTTTGEIDLEDLLGGFGGGAFSSAAGPSSAASGHSDADLFGGAGQRRHSGPRDPEAEVEVTLEEAATGTKRLVQIGERRLEVTIPRGVEDGRRIRLSKTAGSGADAGNVYLVVRVGPHPVFTRNGFDLTRELPVTLRHALLGGEVAVETLTGRVMLRVPPETQNGRIFRLRRQGLPHFSSEERGDLYVKVRVSLPTGLDERARDLARAFLDHVDGADVGTPNPTPAPPQGSRTPSG